MFFEILRLIRSSFVNWGWIEGDDAEVRRRARRIRLSGRIMQSHFWSGENRVRRAPEEKLVGIETLEILSPSPSSGFLGRR